MTVAAMKDEDHILVRFSPELLADMAGEWSDPLQLKPERQEDGTYVLVCRRAAEEEQT